MKEWKIQNIKQDSAEQSVEKKSKGKFEKNALRQMKISSKWMKCNRSANLSACEEKRRLKLTDIRLGRGFFIF